MQAIEAYRENPFLMQMPVGDEHKYGYVANDPVNFVDPSGEAGVITTLIVLGAGSSFIYHIWNYAVDSMNRVHSNADERSKYVFNPVGPQPNWDANKDTVKESATLLKDVADQIALKNIKMTKDLVKKVLLIKRKS